MKTTIITSHEEEYSDKSRTLGVLLNIDQNGKRVDSLIYIYHSGMYIFFNTIIEMNEHLLYGEGRMNRAYLSEEDFDKFYDSIEIDGIFSDKLTWLDQKTPQN